MIRRCLSSFVPSSLSTAPRTHVGIPAATGKNIAVWFLTILLAVIYCTYSLVAHHNLQTSAYDLVIFNQAIRSYANFSLPISILKGVHNEFGPGFSILGDHWSPILVLLAPTYWIHDGPESLLITQAILFAAAVPALYKVVDRTLRQETYISAKARHLTAFSLCLAYGLCWPVVEAVAFDFHEVAFVPLLTALLLERFTAKKPTQVFITALILLQVKEDMGLLVIGFGAYLIGIRSWRRLGIVLICMGSGAVYVCTQILIPFFGGRSNYYWAYGALGNNLSESLLTIVTRPLYSISQLWTPTTKLSLVALTLGVTLFTACLSRYGIITVPLLLERLLASSFPNWWEPKYHYTAFIVVILFVAAADVIARLARALERHRGRRTAHYSDHSKPTTVDRAVTCLALTIAAVNVASAPFFSLGDMFTASFWTGSERTAAAKRALAVIPDRVLIEASNNLAPALSRRTKTLLWDRTPRWAPWVVADAGKKTFPFTSLQEQLSRVEMLKQQGYRQVIDVGEFVVLRRD